MLYAAISTPSAAVMPPCFAPQSPLARRPPAFQPQPEAVALLSARVKEKFDPAGILNPGKMAP